MDKECEKEEYAEGGEVDADQEMLMDHCGLDCVNAIHGKDIGAFRDSFHALVAHSLNKIGLMGDGE